MKNFKLSICYDGTRYRGWQKQGNTENTVQGRLEILLSRLLEQKVELAGSGRTDAGVHAKLQVCSFRADTELTPRELLDKIRLYLPEDIGAYALEEVQPRFHARLSCREKTYCYRIWNSSLPNVFQRRYTYFYPHELSIPLMEEAAAYLLGEHDFTAFCSNKHMKKSAVRELKSIKICEEAQELQIYLTGNGFLYNMARIICGTLIEVGSGRMAPADVKLALLSKDRQLAGPTAPAHGLFLWDIKY